jgi:hypothetical protein
MDWNLQQILVTLGFVIVCGGLVGLYNLGIMLWLIVGIIVLILIKFFLGDLILAGLKIIFHKVVKRRR